MAVDSSPRIRFYKFVTGPKTEGSTLTVGGKQLSGASFASTLSAINSLGATVNSIGVALQKQQKANQAAAAELARRQQLARDKSEENRIESQGPNIGERIGGIISVAAPSLLEWLSRLLKSMFMIAALDWLSDPKNLENITRTFNRIGKFFKAVYNFFSNVVSFFSENWEKTFGKDKTLQERMEGAAKLFGGVALAVAGLAFLKNPLRTVSLFGKLLVGVGKGILNLGKFLGSNVIGQTLLAVGQGVAAYQDVINDESIPTEDRKSAAIGAGVGATTGGMALGMLGNKIAGPLGGLIGNAVGGFLGKHAGKFLGPIVKDTFNALKEFFDKVMKVVNAFLEPIKKATKEFFEALGPAIQKFVDFIEPHLPKLQAAATFLGTVAFAPLIGMLKGLTAILKWVAGGDKNKNQLPEGATENTSGDTIPQEHIDMVDLESAGGKLSYTALPEHSMGGNFYTTEVNNTYNTIRGGSYTSVYKAGEYSIGGVVNKPKTVFLPSKSVPERSKGGWIHGPQSGYPVSLDGGRSVSFIGHGTEYVAQRSAGGFVVPFDTPHTRRDPGLTARRFQEASRLGYFSGGGELPKMSLGGLISGVAGTVGKMLGATAQIASVAPSVASAAGMVGLNPASTGDTIMKVMKALEDAQGMAEDSDLAGKVKTIVLDTIEVPGGTVAAPGGESSTPIVLEGKQNPATQFLQSRFGFMGEASTILSNFF